MKTRSLNDDVQSLVKNREYYAAAWKLIDKTLFREDSDVLRDLKTEVGAILKKAIATCTYAEANRIVRTFRKYLHDADYDEAQLELNGVTIPDEVVELDERALLL